MLFLQFYSVDQSLLNVRVKGECFNCDVHLMLFSHGQSNISQPNFLEMKCVKQSILFLFTSKKSEF